jgi:dephospho-CoA kinase
MKQKKVKKRLKSTNPSEKAYGERDLVNSLWKTMKTQEKKNPAIALLHHRLQDGVYLIGLTGGIASGKSLVSGFLDEARIPVIDADKIARDVVLPGKPASRKILKTFGKELLTPEGEIDRVRLGQIIFADAEKRKALDSITHPEIFRAIAEDVRHYIKANQKLIVIDAALLFESGLADSVDKKILVKTNPDIQLKRLMERDHLMETQARDRIHAQLPTAEKEKLADFVIDNSGHPYETRRQLLEILSKLHHS